MNYLNFEKVVLLSIGFLLLFSTFFTASGLAGKVLADNDLGQHGYYSLAVLYLAFSFWSLYAKQLVARLGSRCSLIVAAITNACYCAAFILPTYPMPLTKNASYDFCILRIILLYLTAIANGFGGSLIWFAQDEYLSNCESREDRDRFIKIFDTILFSSIFIGFLIAALLITVTKNTMKCYSVLTGIASISVLPFYMVKNSGSDKKENSTKEE